MFVGFAFVFFLSQRWDKGVVLAFFFLYLLLMEGKMQACVHLHIVERNRARDREIES